MDKEENFVFYGSWRRSLKSLEKVCGKEWAREVLWQIMEYGTVKDYSTDDQEIINMVEGMCVDLIKSAKKRRTASVENGKKGGRRKQYSDEEIIEMHNAGLTNQDIMDNIGCSQSTIDRALASAPQDDDWDI